MQRWQYTRLRYGHPGPQWTRDGVQDDALQVPIHELLNMLGSEGWELVLADESGFFFKRPID